MTFDWKYALQMVTAYVSLDITHCWGIRTTWCQRHFSLGHKLHTSVSVGGRSACVAYVGRVKDGCIMTLGLSALLLCTSGWSGCSKSIHGIIHIHKHKATHAFIHTPKHLLCETDIATHTYSVHNIPCEVRPPLPWLWDPLLILLPPPFSPLTIQLAN